MKIIESWLMDLAVISVLPFVFMSTALAQDYCATPIFSDKGIEIKVVADRAQVGVQLGYRDNSNAQRTLSVTAIDNSDGSSVGASAQIAPDNFFSEGIYLYAQGVPQGSDPACSSDNSNCSSPPLVGTEGYPEFNEIGQVRTYWTATEDISVIRLSGADGLYTLVLHTSYADGPKTEITCYPAFLSSFDFGSWIGALEAQLSIDTMGQVYPTDYQISCPNDSGTAGELSFCTAPAILSTTGPLVYNTFGVTPELMSSYVRELSGISALVNKAVRTHGTLKQRKMLKTIASRLKELKHSAVYQSGVSKQYQGIVRNALKLAKKGAESTLLARQRTQILRTLQKLF